MATIITHPIIPIAAAYLISKDKVSPRLLIAACLASVLPDFDVIAFRFGVPYGDQFGHRGFTHSVMFAVFIGILGILFSKSLKAGKIIAFTMLFIGSVSHGILDALTDGGQGIAFFWPFDHGRYFFPIRPVEVSPIGLSNFLTARGASVLISELWLIWLPTSMIIFAAYFIKKRRS